MDRAFLLLLILLGACAPVHAQRGSLSLHQAAPVASHAADPLLDLPSERPISLHLPRTSINEGRSAWHSAGIGALIGLGVGSAVGLVAANNRSGGLGDPGPGFVFGVCAGSGTVLGGLIGLVAGSSSGSGGMAFPGY